MGKKLEPELMQAHCEDVASLMKTIAHPQRLMILCHLTDGEKTVSDLLELIDISQSQLSQFLNRMSREKILVSRREAGFSLYSIKDDRVSKLIRNLQGIFCSV